MSRVLFALVVAISVVSCGKGSGQEADKVAVNAAAAGKVLELSGKVTVKGKPVAVGQMLAADDVIETGDDGHVVVELQHNLAHWELGANKSQKVSESIAWKLPKNEGNAQYTISDMSAAGRPAEKSAANTQSSAPAAAAAPAPTAEPAPPPSKGAAPGGAAPPPPPPPVTAKPPTAQPAPPKMESAKSPTPPPDMQPRADLSAASGGGSAPRGGKLMSAEQMVERQEPALKACLAPGATVKLHVVVDATGKAVTTVDDADAKTKACLIKEIGKLAFPAEKASVNMMIEKSNR